MSSDDHGRIANLASRAWRSGPRAVALACSLIFGLSLGCGADRIAEPRGAVSLSIQLSFDPAPVAIGASARAASRTTDYDSLRMAVFGGSSRQKEVPLAALTLPLADTARTFAISMTVPSARRYRVEARLYGGDSDRGRNGLTGRGLLFAGEESTAPTNLPPVVFLRMVDVVPRLSVPPYDVDLGPILEWTAPSESKGFLLDRLLCGTPQSTVSLPGELRSLREAGATDYRIRCITWQGDTSATSELLEVLGCPPGQ